MGDFHCFPGAARTRQEESAEGLSALTPSVAQAPAPARPTGRAALWLAGLGAFFYLSYGVANWLASLRSDVPQIAFAWERHVPFLSWMIIPYWSTNVFYAASFFVCATREELDRHARRLLSAQIVAVLIFIAVPLQFSWPKEETTGLSGFLFEALGAFDKPFNQAPSLHVALTVILWSLYRRHLPRQVLPLFHAWSALVVVSVMTTFQHHFIDIPTGALLGLLCVWAWPQIGPSPLACLALVRDSDRRRLAALYLLSAVIVAALTMISVCYYDINPAWLWALWVCLSLAMVGLAYGIVGPALFQKQADGSTTICASLLLAPYRLGAFLNSRYWTIGDAAQVEVAPGVSIGRFPRASDLSAGAFHAVVDLTAEFAAPRFKGRWHAFPMLDLVAPPSHEVSRAARAVEDSRAHGPVLVCCALGYGRSAAVVAAWLVRSGLAKDAREALARLRQVRPRLAVSTAQVKAIEEAAREP
jgi:protein-tyrosine phosphatase